MLRVTALTAAILGCCVYPLAAEIALIRAGEALSFRNGLSLAGEETGYFALRSTLPLLELAVAVFFLDSFTGRHNRHASAAIAIASVCSVVTVLALSVFFAEEGLVASRIGLTGASTSSLAFVYLPYYGACAGVATFVMVWTVASVVARMRRV
jgi:hypothetical protein